MLKMLELWPVMGLLLTKQIFNGSLKNSKMLAWMTKSGNQRVCKMKPGIVREVYRKAVEAGKTFGQWIEEGIEEKID